MSRVRLYRLIHTEFWHFLQPVSFQTGHGEHSEIDSKEGRDRQGSDTFVSHVMIENQTKPTTPPPGPTNAVEMAPQISSFNMDLFLLHKYITVVLYFKEIAPCARAAKVAGRCARWGRHCGSWPSLRPGSPSTVPPALPPQHSF